MVAGTVAEGQTRHVRALFAQQCQVALEGDTSQRQHDLHRGKQIQLPCQVAPAIDLLLMGWPVLGWDTPHHSGEEGVGQFQAVVSMP